MALFPGTTETGSLPSPKSKLNFEALKALGVKITFPELSVVGVTIKPKFEGTCAEFK
jgi:hypothetical protein